MMRGSSKHEGLTLVEVLIAVVIIGVAFVALSMSQVTNLRVVRDSQEASLATQAANDALEILTQRVLANYVAYQACPGAGICSGTETRGQYTVSFDISRGSGYVWEGLVRIDLDVTGPSTAELHHFISCMDVNPPPTVANPGLCE